jgi:hypothetical protein
MDLGPRPRSFELLQCVGRWDMTRHFLGSARAIVTRGIHALPRGSNALASLCATSLNYDREATAFVSSNIRFLTAGSVMR